MQSDTTDFAPVPPPGELDETYTLFDFGTAFHYMKTWRHPGNW